DDRKYVNGYATIIFDKSNNLFCLNLAQKTKQNFFILCEGNMDCISLYQAGYDNVIAPLGTAFTERQASLLTRYDKKVYIAMDSDEAGVHAIRTKTIPYFDNLDIDTKVIDLKPCKDPDEFIVKNGKVKFDERISEAKDSLIFDISCMKGDYDLKSETGLRDYIEEVVKKLANLDNQYTRDIYIKSVSSEIKMDEKKLSSYVDEYLKGNKKATKTVTLDENSYEHKKIEESKKNIDKNELSFIEILTDHLNLVDSVRRYIDVDDIQNEVLKNIYKDILDDKNIDTLINKYSNLSIVDKDNTDKIKQKLASDIIATNSDMDEETSKTTLSFIIKKIKTSSIENKIKDNSASSADIMSLMEKLKEVKNSDFNL
ncbi:MAG: toprim domain-containing protein, partial [Lachnospiraceae bacterium]|nr:toprim domain-containing protein [Lachnospiraceae bacterium]